MLTRSVLIAFAIGLLAGAWGGRELYHYDRYRQIAEARRIEHLNAAGDRARAQAFEKQNRVLRDLHPSIMITPATERPFRGI